MEKLTLLNLFESIIDEFGVDHDNYPNFDLETFKSLTSYSKRIQYCNKTLRRIASGSSRVVYQVDAGNVLKLAKNSQGLNQNRNEANEYGVSHFENVRTNVIDRDDDGDLWIISEMAKKITPFMFKEYTGVAFNIFSEYVIYRYYRNRKIRSHYLEYTSPEIVDFLNNNEFVEEVVTFMFNNNLAAGDITRISSWGVVNRNGTEQVVLTDYGFTGSY